MRRLSKTRGTILQLLVNRGPRRAASTRVIAKALGRTDPHALNKMLYAMRKRGLLVASPGGHPALNKWHLQPIVDETLLLVKKAEEAAGAGPAPDPNTSGPSWMTTPIEWHDSMEKIRPLLRNLTEA